MKPLNPDFANVSEVPRLAALKLLQEANGATIPIDLIELCRFNDWPLFFMTIEGEKRAATTLMDGDSVQIVVNVKYADNQSGFSNDSTLRRRQRFSLGHEIGHACLNSHKDYGLQKLLEFSESPGMVEKVQNPHATRYKRMRESQANEFAAELLMPQPLLEQSLKTFQWDNVIEEAGYLADEYDVSLTVALRRVTVEANFPALMFYFGTGGEAPQGAIRSRYFSDTELPIPGGASMPNGSLVARLAKDPSSQVSTMRNMNASIWFPNSRKANAFKVQEWAKRIGENGYLSFLSIIEDEDWSGARDDRRGYNDDDDDWGESDNRYRRR